MTLTTVPSYDSSKISTVGEHVVVVGGGVAGLLAAKVLADGFEKITIIDKDPLPDEPVARRGVPQANHVHTMLEAGRAVLEELFDGFTDDIRSAGGLVIDAATDFGYHHEGSFLADSPKKLPMLCASRPLFEQMIRKHVGRLEHVTIRPKTQFISYVTDGAESTVEGVELIDEDRTTRTLTADLVVDATGRTSKTPSWLEQHDYRSPPVEEVHIDLAYSSTVIERPSDDRRGFLISPSPSLQRGGTILPIENDRWIVTLFGLHGDHPPTNKEGFMEFAESLPTPELKQALDTHAWVSSEIQQYPFPSNRWLHYESLDRFPAGLISIGDSVASFNPIYGQGMSVAALDAMQLHHTLATHPSVDFASTYFDRVAKIVNTIWRMTVSADFEFPQTRGPKPFGTDLFNRYISRLIRTAHTDGRVTDAFARVLRLERSPTVLFHPNILVRVLLPMPVNHHV